MTIEKYPSSIIGTLAVADLLFILFLHQFALPTSPEGTQRTLSIFTESIGVYSNLFVAILNFWLLYKLSKGFFSPNLTSMFKKSDISLLFPAPARPQEIFLSKYMKRTFLSLVRWVFILAHALLIAFVFHLSSPQVASAFFAVVLFKETGDLLEYLAFFLKRRIIPRKFPLFRTPFLVLFFIIMFLAPLYSRTLTPLISLLPSAVPVKMILFSFTQTNRTSWMLFGLLVLYLLTILVVSLSANTDCYEEIDSKLSVSSPGKWVTLCRNLIQWNRIRFSDPALMMALKDLLLDLRNVKIVLVIALEYVGLAAIYFSKPFFLDIKPRHVAGFEFVLIHIMLWLSSSVVFPTILCFAREKKTIYILKCAPILAKKIVTEKYFYSLLSSALITMPIMLSTVTIFGVQPFLVTGFTVCYLVISNAVAIMIASYYPQFSDNLSCIPIRLFAAFYSLTFLATILIPSVLYPLMQNPAFYLTATLFSIYMWVSVTLCLRKALEGLLSCFYLSLL